MTCSRFSVGYSIIDTDHDEHAVWLQIDDIVADTTVEIQRGIAVDTLIEKTVAGKAAATLSTKPVPNVPCVRLSPKKMIFMTGS